MVTNRTWNGFSNLRRAQGEKMNGIKFAGIGIVSLLLLSAIGTGEVNLGKMDAENAFYGATAESVDISLDFSHPLTSDNGQYVNVEINGAESTISGNGIPSLPVCSKVLTFPFGTKIEGIDVKIGDVQTMYLDKKITPAPEPLPLNTENLKAEVKEGTVYKSIETYPSNWATYNIGAGIENGEHVVFLSIHAFPARYAPSTNELEYVDEINIEVKHTPPEESMLTNDVYDLLIVAPSDFGNVLQPLVEHKNFYGMRTIMVTLDEIYNSNYFAVQGRDDAEKVKYFIKNSIEEWGIDYVLLVGDIEKMPCREVWSFWGGGQMYSDQYYADIYHANASFCSWDSNENNKFGETDSDGSENDLVDLYSDVHVGRWSCNNVEEVNTVSNKTITYEDKTYGQEWFNNLILMGGDTFPVWNDIAEGETVNKYVEDATPEFNHIKIQTSLRNFLPNKINNAVTDGAGFISYSGHGFQYGFGTYPKNSRWMIAYYTPYLLNLKNGDKLPIIFFDACLTAKLDYHMLGNPDVPCFAWCMVKKPDGGAIATIGATETATTTVDESGPHGQAGYMNLHFFMAYEPGIYISDMLVKAQNDYLNDVTKDEANDRFYIMTIEQFILLGDPSLKVGGYEYPQI